MDINYIWSSFSFFKPEIALASVFVIVLLFDLFFKKHNRLLPTLSIIGVFVVAYFVSVNPVSKGFLFGNNLTRETVGMLVSDNFSNFFKIIILLATVFIFVFSIHSSEIKKSENKGEYYVIILGMTLGMFLMVSSVDLVMIYLSMEMVSLSSYILAGYTKNIYRSSEASLKYLIYGAASSGFMIYGISILYGMTGSTNLYVINSSLAGLMEINKFLITLSGLLIIAGIGFKVSMVPFHFWTPDVYEGAPITITALLSVASKAAGFAILIRFLKISFIDLQSSAIHASTWVSFSFFNWHLIIAILSVLSMTLGNLVALWQNNLKRMLAYSSIAHAGYMLMGLVVMDNQGLMAILLYFVFYLLMNLGAFYCLMLLSDAINSEEIDDFKGLGYKAPFIGVMFTIFLVSLAGLPPTAGFIGKLYLFTALIRTEYFWLALIGVLNSVVSLYFYVRIIRNMFLRQPSDETKFNNLDLQKIIVLMLLAIPTILFGVYFQPVLQVAQEAVKILGF